MKNKFKKIMAVVATTFLVGSSIGMATAAGGTFPLPFVKDNSADYAIVYGSNAAVSDVTGANSLNDYLNTFYSSESTVTTDSTITNIITTSDFSSASNVVYDDLVLGDSFSKSLTDNKISSLMDGDFRWDDGTGSKNYDVHEEINLLDNKVQLLTTLDNNELNSSVVLTNNHGLEYKYVFEDSLDIAAIGTDDADELYLTILGKEYEVLSMDSNSLTVSLSSENIVQVGDSLIVEGITLNIGDIFDDSVQVNGVLIDEGRKKTVNGLEVYVDTVAYHSSSTLPSKAILKVGKDIEQTFDHGEEYVEGDETWEWIIDEPGTVNGYIGVQYNRNSVGFDDDDLEDNAIQVGQSYIFPENYAAVTFDSLTDVSYEDIELSFDDVKLYNGIDSTPRSSVEVAMLVGENDDSIIIDPETSAFETSRLYLEYVPAIEEILDDPLTPENESVEGTPAMVDVYFKDLNGDIDADNEGRNQYFASYDSDSTIAKVIVGDTERNVEVSFNNGDVELSIGDIVMNLGRNADDEFDGLGTESDAESSDVVIGTNNVGNEEEDIMNHYGTIINDPENNAGNDRVVLSVPSEQVYAQVSVKGQGTQVINTETVNNTVETNVNDTVVPVVTSLGGVIVKDTEISSVVNKNLILVGGSCINTETARLLGGKACGEDFTLQTGVISGKYLIQTFTSAHNANKVAVVAAGYSAADTSKAINSIVNTNLDISLGQKYIV